MLRDNMLAHQPLTGLNLSDEQILLQRKLSVTQSVINEKFPEYNNLDRQLTSNSRALNELYAKRSQYENDYRIAVKREHFLAGQGYLTEIDKLKPLIHTQEVAQQQLFRKKSELEKNVELKELIDYCDEINKQLKEYNQKKHEEEEYSEDQPGISNWLKRKYRDIKNHLLPATVTGADISGTVGFVSNIIIKVLNLGSKVAAGAMYFFSKVSTPLALSAMGAGALIETYAIWKNEKIKQRNTRYAANAATLSLLLVAGLVVGGAIVAPALTIPLIFLSISFIGYKKDVYLLEQLANEVKAEEDAIEEMSNKLQKIINPLIKNDLALEEINQNIIECQKKLCFYQDEKNKSLFQNDPDFKSDAQALSTELAGLKKSMSDELMKNPQVEYLAFRIQEQKARCETMKKDLEQMQENLNIRKAFLVSIGFLAAGTIFTMASAIIPPLAPILLPLAGLCSFVGAVIILGAALVGTYCRFKQTADKEDLQQAQKERNVCLELNKAITYSYNKDLTHQNYMSKKIANGLCDKESSHGATYALLSSHSGSTPSKMASSNVASFMSKNSSPVSRLSSTTVAPTTTPSTSPSEQPATMLAKVKR